MRVGAGFLDALRDGAAAVADLEAYVPKWIEDLLDEFPGFRVELVGIFREEKEDVDIGAGG